MKICTWPGQFIGLQQNTRSSGSTVTNIFSLIVLPVAGELPEVLLHHVGRVHLVVAGRVEAAAHVGDERLEQRPALGVPEHRARRLFLEMEEVHLAAELAVVALLGFLEPV